jgi:hypothetical protein
MRQSALFFCVLVVLLTLVFTANAQQNNHHDAITTWFLEERFLIADQNEDALLSTAELRQYECEFSYYLIEQHFKICDSNTDGHLSYNEILRRVRSEFVYRTSMDQKNARAAMADYPGVTSIDAKFLRHHPEVTRKLFANYYWLQMNPDIAADLYKDPLWAVTNREAIVALHKNLRWMTANPTHAKMLYGYSGATGSLPEFMGWRNDHKELMRKYPNVDRLDGQTFFYIIR